MAVPGTSAQGSSAAVDPLPGAAWHTSGELAPGNSVTWSVRVKASKIGMTGFGVYPLQVQVQSVLGTPLASQTTYLPYEPGKKGGARGPTPPKVKSPFGPGMPAGFPDLSQMPEGLNELPPGLADFDLSKLKFPGQK